MNLDHNHYVVKQKGKLGWIKTSPWNDVYDAQGNCVFRSNRMTVKYQDVDQFVKEGMALFACDHDERKKSKTNGGESAYDQNHALWKTKQPSDLAGTNALVDVIDCRSGKRIGSLGSPGRMKDRIERRRLVLGDWSIYDANGHVAAEVTSIRKFWSKKYSFEIRVGDSVVGHIYRKRMWHMTLHIDLKPESGHAPDRRLLLLLVSMLSALPLVAPIGIP